MPPKSLLDPMAISSSLDSIHISPRTPKTPRTPRIGMNGNREEVELSLLGEEERRLAAQGLDDEGELGYGGGYESKRPAPNKDRKEMILLSVLCEFTFSKLCIIFVKFPVNRPYSRGSSEFLLRHRLKIQTYRIITS